MAAAVKALNARIRQNKYLDYVCSTHFWGPVSNFGIPVAAVMDTQKDPELISGRMTAALTVYSTVFARYALAVSPANYLLFGCHVINASAQCVQGYRFLNYWNWGGREKALETRAKLGVENVKDRAVAAGETVKDKAVAAGQAVKAKANEIAK